MARKTDRKRIKGWSKMAETQPNSYLGALKYKDGVSILKLVLLRNKSPIISYKTFFHTLSLLGVNKQEAWILLRELRDKGALYLSKKYVLVVV
jgi:hypothetical protein